MTRLLLLSILTLSMSVAACGSADLAKQPAVDAHAAVNCTPEDEPCRTAAVEDEYVGEIRDELTSAQAIALFGEPEKKGETWLEEATGVWVQEWHWPAKGIEIVMGSGSKAGAQTVYNYTVAAPFAGATARGIAVGATEAEVRKAYAGLADPDFTTRGRVFIAGSIYGGVFFNFEDGRVKTIFIGAGAE